jgi:hypothetical protein
VFSPSGPGPVLPVVLPAILGIPLFRCFLAPVRGSGSGARPGLVGQRARPGRVLDSRTIGVNVVSCCRMACQTPGDRGTESQRDCDM